jgi:CPA1 family monovalent cation:H+ antiporter
LIQGESLFNDGVGILLFGAALTYATGRAVPGTGELLGAMLREGLGGATLGVAFGAIALLAMRAIDDYAVETGITVALATSVYVTAARLHVSGPIAAAAAGILVGGPHAEAAMSHTTKRHVRGFWRLVDEILNSLLFLLVGLELLEMPLEPRFGLVAAAAIPIVLVARLASVLAPSLVLMRLRREFGRETIPVLTWSGVRGGLSIALALAVPDSPEKPLLLAVTYAVAIFSIVVQGLTLGRLVRRLGGREEQAGAP